MFIGRLGHCQIPWTCIDKNKQKIREIKLYVWINNFMLMSCMPFLSKDIPERGHEFYVWNIAYQYFEPFVKA